MDLSAIKNHILFEFSDQVINKAFANETTWGFTVLDRNEDVKLARWAKVLACGPDVNSDINVGDYIYIEPLAWTTKVAINKKDYWMTNDTKVLLVSDELPKAL
jgi:hypothetical protein